LQKAKSQLRQKSYYGGFDRGDMFPPLGGAIIRGSLRGSHFFVLGEKFFRVFEMEEILLGGSGFLVYGLLPCFPFREQGSLPTLKGIVYISFAEEGEKSSLLPRTLEGLISFS